MKNIIVGLLTLLIIGLMSYTAMQGGAYHGGEQGRIIADIKESSAKPAQPAQISAEEDDAKIEQEQLKALRDKAGNIAAFNVSQNFKRKCSSCHGSSGEGIVGPKLIGQTSDVIYQKLLDYKSGKAQNTIMKGVVLNIDKAQLKELADEIGGFEAKAAAQP